MHVSASRLTGFFALACVALWLAQFPLYALNDVPSVYDGAAYAAHLRANSTIAFTRILLDQGVYVTLMLFAANLRHLIVVASPRREWLATTMLGAAIVWIAVTLVADGLAGGATLEAIGPAPDGSAVKALIEGTLLIYNSSTAFVMTAFFVAIAAYTASAAGVLPPWTGWVGFVAAGLCVASVPAMFGGPIDYRGLYNAAGWLPAAVANFPPAAWFASAGVLLVVKPRKGDT